MANIGARHPKWAPIATEPVNGLPTYNGAAAVLVGKLISAEATPTYASGSLYADDVLAESVDEFVSASISMSTDDLVPGVLSAIFGAHEDAGTPGLVTYKSTDAQPYGGLGYLAYLMRGGVKLFKAYFYPKVKATLGADAANTKTDSITFGTQSLTFTVFEANDHTWKITEEFVGATAEQDAKAWLDARLGVPGGGGGITGAIIGVSINGIPVVGNTLAAVTDPPNAPAAFQWMADSADLVGATAKTFSLTNAEVGKEMRVRAHGVETYSGDVVSDPTVPVQPGTGPVPLDGVKIDGIAMVGHTLAATLSPAGANADFEWVADGETIPGESGPTLTLAEGERGKTVYVVANGKDGYSGIAWSKAVGPVKEELKNVRVTGTALTGQPLTAVPEPSYATVTYQWSKGTDPIPGAAAPTYVPNAEDLGETIRVTATGYGLFVGIWDSVPTKGVGPGPLDSVIIVGTPLVGESLELNVVPREAERYSTYQWSAGGVPIPNATGESYVVDALDIGKEITVKATGDGTTYTGTVNSLPTAPVTG
jgi:hypothetical protein